MSGSVGPLILTILSEDSAQGFDTVVALLRRTLTTLDHVGHEMVSFRPSSNALAMSASRANRWRSGSPEDYEKKASLVRMIATQLAAGGVVFFHYDGDRIWSDRERSIAGQQFEREIVARVRQLLLGVRGGSKVEAIGNLIAVVPYYSIEAWTYQATSRAQEICAREYGGRHAEKFQQWGDDRSALDEVDKPKDATCLGGRHNARLAGAFPANDVLAAGKSFRVLVEALRACEPLAVLVRQFG